MKKIKKLLGLTEEAPQPGHWLEGLRNAGTTNVPATTGDVNTSAIERMMNTPMDRRTMMERTRQAAQAASMAGRLGGALENVLPQAVDEAPAFSGPAYGYFENLLKDRITALTPEARAKIIEDWDEPADDLVRYLEELPELENLKLKNIRSPEVAVDRAVDYLLKNMEDLGDDGMDYANGLMSTFKALGISGKKHKELPDFWEIFENTLEPPPSSRGWRSPEGAIDSPASRAVEAQIDEIDNQISSGRFRGDTDALWAAQLRRADLIEERRKLQFPNGDE